MNNVIDNKKNLELFEGVEVSHYFPDNLILLAIGCIVLPAPRHVFMSSQMTSIHLRFGRPLTINFHPLHDLPNVVVWPSFNVVIPAEAVFLRFLDDRRHA